MLLDEIKKDQLSARVARNKQVTSILTTLIGELETLSKGKNVILSDLEVIAVIKKFKTNILFTLEKSTGDISHLRIELEALEKYLPQQLSEVQLLTIIRGAFLAMPTASTGEIMKHLKQNHPGMYDGALANKLIKDILSSSLFNSLM